MLLLFIFWASPFKQFDNFSYWFRKVSFYRLLLPFRKTIMMTNLATGQAYRDILHVTVIYFKAGHFKQFNKFATRQTRCLYTSYYSLVMTNLAPGQA